MDNDTGEMNQRPAGTKSIVDVEAKTLTLKFPGGEDVLYDLAKLPPNALWWCVARGLGLRLAKAKDPAEAFNDLCDGVIPAERKPDGEKPLAMTDQALMLALRDQMAKRDGISKKEKAAFEALLLQAEATVRAMDKAKRKVLSTDAAVVEWLGSLRATARRKEAEKNGQKSLLELVE